MADKETQIKTLLYGDPLGFACKTLGVENMLHHSYSEVFTVSFDEIYDYTLKYGLPGLGSGSADEPPEPEGFHYYKKDDRWNTYFTERGHRCDEKTFDDETQGKKYIVRTLLKLRGTGLY